MRAHRIVALAAVLGLAAAGCTSVSPEASVAPSGSASASASALATAPGSAAPSVPAVSAPPSTEVATPKPSKPPKATPPTGPAQANLIVSKVATKADPFLTGVDTQIDVTIKNVGNAEAGSFSIGVSYLRDDGLGQGTQSGAPVDGLAAGKSVRVAVNYTLPDPGAVTFTATVDIGDEVAESNEDDNTGTLSVTAVAALPNLVIDSFTMQPDPENPGDYRSDYEVRNSGTADLTQPFQVAYTWALASGGVGSFDGDSCCTHPQPVLAAGQTAGITHSALHFPSSGTYIVTIAADPANEISESDETDNYATASVNVP